ncbi:hypothetical protein SESBI_48999 [Sesbania bispinosa]|nr:hypothetical protein SESBI_48999 [Sesbania bispinosa]
MAPPLFLGYRKVLLFSVLFFLFASVCISTCSEPQLESKQLHSRRVLLELEEQQEEFEHPLKKKSTKNQTKLIKPKTNNNLSLKNQTKTIKSNNNLSTTKLPKTTSLTLNSTTFKTKKLNSTSSKSLTNSTSTKKSLDLAKATGAKNKTTKATAAITKNNKETDIKIKKDSSDQSETEKKPKQSNKKTNVVKKQSLPSWIFEDEDGDFVSEFKDLPIKFQQTLIPDLERISTTSKAYITKANKQITKGFKPYVGNKYAPTIATLLSCAFVLIPLVLVSFLFNKIKAYFSLQKLLIFIQAYLSIYFSILCLSSLVTGLEPLRLWAGLEVPGPGPNVRGLRRRPALLHDGVSQGCVAATAED